MAISACGKDCARCKALAQNIVYSDERAELKAMLKKYMDIDLPAERLYCDGCKSWIPSAQRLYANCEIRACAKKKHKKHCGKCDEFPCDIFLEKAGVSMLEAMKKLDTNFNEIEYKEYISPYDNKTTIEAFKLTGHIKRKD